MIACGFARRSPILAIVLALAATFCGKYTRVFAQSPEPTTSVAATEAPAAGAIADPAAVPSAGSVSTDESASPATTFKGAATGAIPTRNLFSIVREGGLAMLPLLVCSFVLLVFVFERTISLRRGRVVPGPFVTRFLQQLKEGQLDRDGAVKVCQENGSPVARVFAAAVKKWGRPAVEVEQAIIDAGERVVHELRRYLRVFNSIATIGPMLGLLGTVGGMIRAFNNIASSDAMGRPELLAKGISEALLTTATGLAVAVPAIVLYWWFVSVVDRLTVRIDGLGQDVVGLISAEAIQEAAAAKPSRASRKTAA
jgi:biopolymer transport protein ExbB